jgi:hypothetical protein
MDMKNETDRTMSGKFFALAAIILTIFTFACSGGGGGGTPSGSTGGNSPGIGLSTSSMDFGNTVIGQTTERLLTVNSTGDDPLEIGQISDPPAPFSIVSDACSGKRLAPGVSCIVAVQFEPTEQQDDLDGSFVVPSNDPNDSSLRVALTGNGTGLAVAITDVVLNGCVPAPPETATVTVSVRDGNNDPVTGLEVGAFTASGYTISNFLSGQAVPVSVALTLDFSNSLVQAHGELEIQAAATAFIDSLNPTDRAAVYKFAQRVDTEQDFVDADVDGKADLIAAIERETDLSSPTKLFEAANFAVQQVADENSTNRVVVLVTDGNDDDSSVSLDLLIDNAKDEGVLIFSVILGPPISSSEVEVMQRLAQETGGQYFEASDAAQLADVYGQISRILGNQYTFDISDPDEGGDLNVEVEDDTGRRGRDSAVIPNC